MPPKPPTKSSPIIIIGGGAFGLSTALHLVQDGYTDISVFERDETIPPRYSAANDINKIVRAEYEDEFYTGLSIKAIQAWKTPLFAPHFHQTGFLHCVSGTAPPKALSTLNRFQNAAVSNPVIAPHVIPFKGEDTTHDLFWQYAGQLRGWHGYLNRFDGYAHSANALEAVYRATQAAGVRFYLGGRGRVREVVYRGTGEGRKAVGVRGEDGVFHGAAVVIVAAGAAVGKLVPEVGAEVVAKSWSVAHVRLSEEETSQLRGVPVTYARDLGFFFEPDPVTRLLKLCPMGGGIVNTDPKTGISHAPGTLAESAFMPADDERQVRELLRQALPWLAERPLVKKSLCWFADTSDSDFIVDYVPGTNGSVVVLSGDSGHGFKMFPIVGEWTKALLENERGEQVVKRWRWKVPKAQNGEKGWGGDVSWRLGQEKELRDVLPSVTKL